MTEVSYFLLKLALFLSSSNMFISLYYDIITKTLLKA